MTTKEETLVALTCPSCGNDQNFLVKTLQMHVVHLGGATVVAEPRQVYRPRRPRQVWGDPLAPESNTERARQRGRETDVEHEVRMAVSQAPTEPGEAA